MIVNGRPARLSGRHETALDAIRGDLGLTGAKLVCGTGVCGACTVALDGVPVASCVLPVEDLDDADVTTVEGVGAEDGLHPVQAAFLAHDALQCGYCTPGFVVEAAEFFRRWRAERGTERPDRPTIARALAGHLCRCGAYDGIYRAVADACAGRFDASRPGGPRVDGMEKVTGAARYTTDVHLDALVGRIIRSETPHATLVGIDPAPALAIRGVVAFAPLVEDGERIRYHGTPLAAVAATDEATASRVAEAVVVVTRPHSAVVGAAQALADEAPDVHGWWIPPSNNEAPAVPNLRRRNLVGPTPYGSVRPLAARNRIRRAKGDPLLVEGSWSTSVHAHTAFEPHAAVAEWHSDGSLTVHLSTQGVTRSRDQLANELGLDPGQVTIRAVYVGGAFGAKQSPGVEPVAAALLARQAGQPVRVILDRVEEMTVGGNRPGVDADLALLGSLDGGMEAIRMRAVADAGASAGSLVASGIPRLVYPGAPRLLVDYDAVSNAPPGTAFRAPGGPPAVFALEQAVDELAERRDVDPVALRREWNRRPLRAAMYDWVESHPLWVNRRTATTARLRRGVGAAFGSWFNAHEPRVEITVGSSRDGFTVATGSQDIGNGTRTVLASAVAEVFGLDPQQVTVEVGRSELGIGPLSSGSRTTTTVWPAAHSASLALRSHLLDRARDRLGLTGARLAEGGLDHAGERLGWLDLVGRLDPAQATAGRPADRRRLVPFTVAVGGLEFGWGLTESAHVIEVEVDMRSGTVRVLRTDTRIAAGRIFSPDLARSQVFGGVIQGLGMALHEQRRLDPYSGAVLSTNLEDYHLLGIGDTPEMEVDFIEWGFEHIAGHGVGLAELGIVAVPAAVAAAVAHATGRRFRSLPITPASFRVATT